MTMQLDIAEAQERLAELIERAVLSEEIIVEKDNKPVAKIVPLLPAERQPGTAKGQLRISEDFDAPVDDFAEYQ